MSINKYHENVNKFTVHVTFTYATPNTQFVFAPSNSSFHKSFHKYTGLMQTNGGFTFGNV